MRNLTGMMKKVHEMNNKLEKAQKDLDSKEFTSKVGDGASQ